jgi:hypothetical protein
MSWMTEYKNSLKSYDVEEILDLYFFRPLSFLFVKLIYPTNITPNQISVFSMLFGILAGVMFGFGQPFFLIMAGIALLVSNVLDCADGQLARLKKNGTGIGRIIDGFIDYVTGFSVFAGIGIGMSLMSDNYLYIWVITVIGGFSRVLQNMLFDYYRNVYLQYVYGRGSDIAKEIDEYSRMKVILDKQKGRYGEKFLVNIYIKYSKVQMNSTNKEEVLKVTPEEYKTKNKLMLRMWSWLGSTTHLAAVIIACYTNRIEYYLWITFTLGNLFMLIFYLIQKKTIKEYSV